MSTILSSTLKFMLNVLVRVSLGPTATSLVGTTPYYSYHASYRKSENVSKHTTKSKSTWA